MKNVLNIFAFIFSAVILFSCEPRTDDNGDYLVGLNQNSDTGTGGGTTSVIKKIKSVTYDDPSGGVVTMNYNYTAGNLVSVRTSDNSISYDLIYENNIIKKINVIEESNNITKTNFTITYNYNTGIFVQATGLGSEGTGSDFTNTITANFTNNKVSKVTSKFVGIDSADPNITYDLYTLQNDMTYTGNNIATWKATTAFAPTPPIILPSIIINATFSDYDNKVNPFYNLPQVFNIISSQFDQDKFGITSFSANNYKKINVVSNADNQTATYVYTYDADGYPTKAVASANLGTLTFEYIK
jgi:hypothetical protein